jgi:hypothetical protein
MREKGSMRYHQYKESRSVGDGKQERGKGILYNSHHRIRPKEIVGASKQAREGGVTMNKSKQESRRGCES